MGVAAVVLAAGASQRMAAPKPLVRWRGKTFVEHVIALARGAGAIPIAVVQGAWPLPAQVVHGVTLVDHRGWTDGPLSSLQAGLRTVLADRPVDGVLVLTVDRPHVAVQTVRALVEAFDRDPRFVWQPAVQGKRGHPLVLPREIAEAALQLPPTRTLRMLLRRDDVAARRKTFETDDQAVLQNIDTPGDVDSLP